MRMENDLIARKLNLLTVFFPALAPSYKEIILNSFDQYSLLKAYVRRIMDNYPGIQAEDHEKLEKALHNLCGIRKWTVSINTCLPNSAMKPLKRW